MHLQKAYPKQPQKNQNCKPQHTAQNHKTKKQKMLNQNPYSCYYIS